MNIYSTGKFLKTYQSAKFIAILCSELRLQYIARLVTKENSLDIILRIQKVIFEIHSYFHGNGFKLNKSLIKHLNLNTSCITLE
ncbi:MAG: hypothetical protein H0A74_00880 [Candidatus Vesicomyosocius endoextente]|uniref:Uncharacterized protein n=1 Tax=Candidatus Vesicomyosocius endoextente TaxID=2738853 RepID=A0A853G8U3_9GAMM|nr:hypothetical protein [Candidatus Vesicomyosocius endoextente]